ETAFQHAAVVKSERNGANADENLIFVRNWLFDSFKFQNVIGRPVLAIPNGFHQLGSRRDVASAVVCGRPVGKLEPSEKDDEDGECAPVQDSFDFHWPNESDWTDSTGSLPPGLFTAKNVSQKPVSTIARPISGKQIDQNTARCSGKIKRAKYKA